MGLGLLSKKTKKQHSEEREPANSVEPTTLSNEAKKLAEDSIRESWEQLFGGINESISEQIMGAGELLEGQEVALKKKQEAKKAEEKQEKKAVTSEHIEYFRTVQNVETYADARTEQEITQAVEQIRMEIKKLLATSKLVERTVKDATADKAPVKPGKYHLTFFEFVLNVIRDATSKLEDTAHYGAVFTSKKQQSKYWNSYKNQGTSFGLSGERSSATQTG